VPGRYSIELVDFLEPQLAKGDEIIAIPTLVRKTPSRFGRLWEIYQTKKNIGRSVT
jgi:hypothetical protein